jgi:HEAT repeat protein
MRCSLTIVLPTLALLFFGVLPLTASGYSATPLAKALKEHPLVLVAKVLRRADGKVQLAAEKMIKGTMERESFALPETRSEESRIWSPFTLLEHKRYLLILHRDDGGNPIYSKDPLAESVREVAAVDDPPVRTAAVVQQLLTAPDAAARSRVLEEAWTNESDEVKTSILKVLLQRERDEATVPFLIRCIEAGASRSNLMELSAVTIGRFGYRQAVPALLEALKKDDWGCIFPAQALAKLKVRRAYRPLRELIESPRTGDRVYYIEALCQLDDERSIPFLIETAQRNLRGIDPDFSNNRSFDVRENQFAVACLGRLRARQATDVLEKIADQSQHQQLRQLARQALRSIRAAP